MNLLVSGRLPRGMRIRRNFTFGPGEKDRLNRLYRFLVDRWLVSRWESTDHFFSIEPIDQERLRRIVSLSRWNEVELMVHPGVNAQYEYLLSPDWAAFITGQ
jgi:hypothetical protein